MIQNHLEALSDESIDIAENIVKKSEEDIEDFVDMLDVDFDIDITYEEAEELLEFIHSSATEALMSWAKSKMK